MTQDSQEGPEDDAGQEDEAGLTYSGVGVDIEDSEAATRALIESAGEAIETEYAGMVPFGEHYLALATDGVGTKLMVAEAIEDYSTIGIDCVAMNANDLVAAGVDPVGFVDYLAVEQPGEDLAEEVGEGLAIGVELAGASLLGGETAVMPEVIRGFDLAGTCLGVAEQESVFEGEAQVGDRLVGWASSGIHSNGLTLAREAVTREYDYSDPFPPNPEKTVGEELLEPTRIYADLLEPMRAANVHAAAHVTGGGWTNLERMGEFRYEVTDPHPIQPVFEFVQEEGDVTDREMHRTFNVGTGFVAAVPEDRADSLAGETGGKVIGRVEEGDAVGIRGLEL
jgi:phosphoribosylformylglycinamidine cyclo-ligase